MIRRLRAGLLLMSGLLLAACGNLPTPTHILLPVTATMVPLLATDTPIPPTPRPVTPAPSTATNAPANTPAPILAVSTPAPAAARPPPAVDINTVIAIAPNPQFTKQGEAVAVVGQFTNKDNVAHTIQIQANVYNVPTDQLGDDPAQYLITAAQAVVTLGPGEQRTVTITAKDVLPDPIQAVDFTVSEK